MSSARSSDSVELWASVFNGNVTLTLRISGGGSYPFTPRPVADINAANDELFDKVDDFSLDVHRWQTLPAPDKDKHLRDIEAAGRALGHALFGAELPIFASLIERYGARRLELVVEDETFSPYWDFVRLPSASGEAYLGELVTITPGYILRVDDQPDDLAEEYATTVLDDFTIGLAEDETLPSACRDRHSRARSSVEELYVLEPIVKHVDDVDILPPLNPKARSAEVTGLNLWLSLQRRVVHFNCHGRGAGRGRNVDPELEISRAFRVGKADLDADDLSYALVNLNVCESAVGTYSRRRTLVQAFHDQNAHATIATTFSVDDRFATEFARSLYTRLATSDLLTSMHETRKAMLAQHNHPMSLMYTFTGASSFRLDKV